MKIAVLPTIRDLSWGAPGAFMGALVEKLLSRRHEVLWLVAPIDLKHLEVVRLAALGARVVPLPEGAPHYVKLRALRLQVRAMAGGRPTLRRLLNEFSPDHIFVNEGGAWTALADEELSDCLHDWSGRYSLIVHLNHPQRPFSPALFQRARIQIAEARTVFFNSHWVRQLAQLQICSTIPNAASFQLPFKNPCTVPLSWPDGPLPRLAMVNRLDAYHKGIDVALRALAHLKAEGLTAQLGIYGSGQDQEYLVKLAEYLGVGDLVTFHGHQDDIAEIWKNEELLLLPSRFEGLAVSMIEAMSFGRPVLRTPYGGAAEWIEDGINGYICPSADEEFLFRTLQRAIADRARWREYGLRAHEKVKRCLDPDPANIFLSALAG